MRTSAEAKASPLYGNRDNLQLQQMLDGQCAPRNLHVNGVATHGALSPGARTRRVRFDDISSVLCYLSPIYEWTEGDYVAHMPGIHEWPTLKEEKVPANFKPLSTNQCDGECVIEETPPRSEGQVLRRPGVWKRLTLENVDAREAALRLKRSTHEDDFDDAAFAALRNAVFNLVQGQRFSEDGVAYTHAEFLQHFGVDDGQARWIQGRPRDLLKEGL